MTRKTCYYGLGGAALALAGVAYGHAQTVNIKPVQHASQLRPVPGNGAGLAGGLSAAETPGVLDPNSREVAPVRWVGFRFHRTLRHTRAWQNLHAHRRHAR